MEFFTYKGISDSKYVEGEVEALNQEEASHKLKEQKIIITNLIKSKSKTFAFTFFFFFAFFFLRFN
jgi:type IV pilus assembly protein PilC